MRYIYPTLRRWPQYWRDMYDPHFFGLANYNIEFISVLKVLLSILEGIRKLNKKFTLQIWSLYEGFRFHQLNDGFDVQELCRPLRHENELQYDR